MTATVPAQALSSTSVVLARAFPWALALTFLSTFMVSFWLNASIVSAVGLLLGATFVLVGLVAGPRRFSARFAALTGAVAAAVALFALTSLLSASPAVSMVGAVGQHNGTALWVLGAVWLLAGALCADARSLRESLIVVAGAGVLFAAAMLREVFVVGLYRAQGLAAGQFDNSTSLGEFLAVATVAALAWALFARRSLERSIAALVAVLLAAELVVSGSRTGLLGLILTILFAMAVRWLPRSRTNAVALSLAPALAIATTTLLGVLASEGDLGRWAARILATVGTDRDVIWRSAWAQVRQAPLLGSGLEQFSAWIAVSAQGGHAAFDPHNMILAVMLGAGAAGIVLAGVTMVALTRCLLDVARAPASPSLATAIVASLPVTLVGFGAVAWLSPIAVVAVFAVAGASFGVSTPGDSAARYRRGGAKGLSRAKHRADLANTALIVTAGIVAIGALMLGSVTARALPTMIEYVRAQVAPDPEGLAAAYGRWPDPEYAVLLIDELLPQATQPGAARDLRAILDASRNDASWRVDSAVAQIQGAESLGSQDPELMSDIVALAESGAHADPTSGIWWVLVATQASRLGLADQARHYAQKALGYHLPPDLDAKMRTLVTY